MRWKRAAAFPQLRGSEYLCTQRHLLKRALSNADSLAIKQTNDKDPVRRAIRKRLSEGPFKGPPRQRLCDVRHPVASIAGSLRLTRHGPYTVIARALREVRPVESQPRIVRRPSPVQPPVQQHPMQVEHLESQPKLLHRNSPVQQRPVHIRDNQLQR